MDCDFPDIDDEELVQLSFGSPELGFDDGIDSLSCAMSDVDLMDGRKCVPFASRLTTHSLDFEDPHGAEDQTPCLPDGSAASFVIAGLHSPLKRHAALSLTGQLPYIDGAEIATNIRPVQCITNFDDPVHISQSYFRRLTFEPDCLTVEQQGVRVAPAASPTRQIDLFARNSPSRSRSTTPRGRKSLNDADDRRCMTPARVQPATHTQRCMTPSGLKTRLRGPPVSRSPQPQHQRKKRTKTSVTGYSRPFDRVNYLD